MKKLLLLLALVPGVVFAEQMVADNLIKFMDMEKGHKTDWIKYKKEKGAKLMDLKIEHMNQWIDVKETFIKELGKGMPVKEALRNKLRAAIKLHATQNKEWAKMCKANYDKEGEIAKKHEAELHDFMKGLKAEMLKAQTMEKGMTAPKAVMPIKEEAPEEMATN